VFIFKNEESESYPYLNVYSILKHSVRKQ